MRKKFFGISSLLIIAALNVNSANPVTPNGVTGFATYNAVDAVKADGSVVKGNHGAGADISHRVPWSRQLTKKEAQKITLEQVLSH